MTQQSGNQFDDDLTAGLDDDGSFSTDSIDLFEFSGGEESPIAKLKTIILSIDWEINDEILQQLDDELVDLADIWADDKIKLVYIQGLSKIGKYIDKEKAAAHPNSIKLLITFYHNLEKIVSAEDEMSESEKKALLIADVKKFDQLKAQIGKPSSESRKVEPATPAPPAEIIPENEEEDELKVLKAQVLGLDWEINDKELEKLGSEIKRLEGVYRQSDGKLILLQGIGALSAYIKKMKSQSNSKAFSLLHSFYEVLEKTPSGNLASGEEKQRLLLEVEKFKSFKAEIARAKEEPEPVAAVVVPIPEVTSATNKEVLPEQDKDAEQVASDVESRLASVFGDIDDDSSSIETDKSLALEGVNVETDADDESDEEALPFADGGVAPALANVDTESSFSVDKLAGDLARSFETEEQAEKEIIAEEIIPGVDVESDADDDSDEESLPFVDGEIAPALSGSFDESGFDETDNSDAAHDSDAEDLDSRLGSFFDDEVQSSSQAWETESEESSAFDDDDHVAALSDVTDEVDEIIEDEELSDVADPDFLDDGAPAPALSDSEESLPLDIPIDDTVEEKLSFFDEDNDAPELVDDSNDSADSVDQAAESQLAFLDDDISETTDHEANLEADGELDDEIAGFFDDDAPVAALSDSDESPLEDEGIEDAVDEQLSFFDDEAPAPAFSADVEEESEESPAEEFTAELSVEEDKVEKVVLEEESPTEEDDIEEVAFEEEPLAEEDDTEEIVFEEEPPTEEDVIEEVTFKEEPSAEEETIEEVTFEEESLTEEDDIEEVAFEEDSAAEEEHFEEELSILAEEPDVVENEDEVEESVSISIDEENEESIDTEEIEFTVPGQIATAGVVAAAAASLSSEKESFEDVIDFQVPGEDDSAGMSLDFTEEAEEELVIFEAVEDDVEVDPLPGEEYADKTDESVDEEDTLDFFEAEETDTQSDSISHESEKSISIDYSSLSGMIQSLKGEATNTDLQALFAETNKLRTQNSSNTTGKIFLQLLSTISQHVEKNIDDLDSASLALMDEVYSGLQMSSSSDASVEQVQQKLLTCTSQVILLQQKDILNATTNTAGQQKEEEKATGGAAPAHTSVTDEKLASFVQNELSDIKQLFLDEIRSLRKEIVDK